MSTPPLFIALVSETYSPEINGVANTLGHLVSGLRARGHRLQLIRPRQNHDTPAANDDDLLLTRGWPLPGYPGLQWGQSARHKLLRLWRRQPPDVLYIATEGPLGLSALRAARRLRIPVISGFHTNFQQYTGHYGITLLTRLLTNYLRWFHNASRMTLVPSLSQRCELQRRGFERLELLARGVDAQLFNPARRSDELRRSWGLAEQDIAVLHVGRLAAEKNLDLLVSTFRALQRQSAGLHLRLVIVGDGPLRESLQKQLPDALFCGIQRGETLAQHYASGDIFLFPSLSETFGNVLLEAMASGLGVVAFDQAAAAQHVEDGHNGMLASGDDQRTFIEAAVWLTESSENLRRVRLNARQHAARQNWSSIVEQFEQHLHAALQSNAVPGNGRNPPLVIESKRAH
ncbi:glycosyltransferase family 1 protein [Pseudomonas argentinensis]|uniref:Glycosyltransferase involved in cell wall bisynthesis n=1 Tax=Phytopseudomonas argentinensis TaxID=289370 RepID=A0A1I3HF34_9GAMM|nr:glycosyltransferase family 1 protein [Pseudomonas argentinensis]KAB0548442.1 glycosyltransferase family 1 protein [Pseudomonas argentinensis]SFI34355.1 Glycosyltransferase involved in cell wall bisynthesis [Pseudomonas argentinensis]